MSKRKAVVTGAASGIGKATAELPRERGWTVTGIDRDWPAGPTADDAELDISELGAWHELLSSMSGVDALINNAAVSRPTPLGETDPDAWRALFAINLEAAAVAINALAPALAETAGAVVNIASVHAAASSHGMSAYAASKAGLVGLTRAAAVELGPSGIRVNAIAPGAVDSPMLFPELDGDERDAAVAHLTDRTPLRRIGRPEEIAEAALFLADSTRSGFITGQCLAADGGALARLATE